MAFQRQVGELRAPARARPPSSPRSRRRRSPASLGARDRHPVVTVLDEIHVADLVDLDRRHSTRPGAGHARRAPSVPDPGREVGRKLRSKLAGTVDRPDDRVERDRLQAEPSLSSAPERLDHLLEGEDQIDVAGLTPQARRKPRQHPAAACPRKVASRILAGKARVRHRSSLAPRLYFNFSVLTAGLPYVGSLLRGAPRQGSCPQRQGNPGSARRQRWSLSRPLCSPPLPPSGRPVEAPTGRRPLPRASAARRGRSASGGPAAGSAGSIGFRATTPEA